MPFSETFGGSTVLPANAGYLALDISASISLEWPIENQSANVAADTIDINASIAGLNVDLADARQVGTGFAILFNNVGANTATIRNAVGGTIISLVSGTAWLVYLAANTTAAGSWRTFQLGASVAAASASALAGAGLKAIATTLNQSMSVSSTSTTPVAPVVDDRAKLINWTGGVGTLNLPAVASVGADWFIHIRNSGSGNLTVTPAAGTVDSAATKVFAPGTSAIVVTDGTNWLSVGYGSGTSGSGGFDFLEINAAGSGTLTLAGSQLGRKAYRFTGALTGTRTIVVPGTIEEYWIDNSTSGAFSLYVKTAGQSAPGIEVLTGNRNILYCDGTNVLDAESSTVTFPIAVASGGTGATTASAARTNLGATTTGAAVFTAADAAAGRTALSAVGSARAITTAAASGLSGGGDLSADRSLSINVTDFCTAVRKTAGTTRTTTTVLADDPHLSLTIPVAGLYEVELSLGASRGGTGTDALKFNFGGTATIDGTVVTTGEIQNGPSSGNVLQNSVGFTPGGVDQTIGGYPSDSFHRSHIKALIQFSSTGTLVFRWAMNTGSSGNISLGIGSWMRALRVG